MQIEIDRKLKEINKTRYWLSRETGLIYHHLVKICEGKTSSISFDAEEKICNVLNCELDDIFKIDKNNR